ncbi:MAG TPA: hypothetical protein DCR28_01785 [Eubacterium sp.]|nr:hypothetical protein [Eubacterium sp.]
MINSNLEDTTIVVSSYCIKENKEELEKSTVSPGMDVVMVGSIGVGATLSLAKKYESVLRDKFSSSFVDGVLGLEKVSSTDKYLEMIQEFLASADEKALVYEIGSEGTFAGLYETSKFMGKGIEVEILDIPVWQEVVETAEVFDVNPYKADGTGALIIVCNRGDDMVKWFLDEGILASVIGKVTDNNDKVARNGDEVRYLEPTRVEELANLL